MKIEKRIQEDPTAEIRIWRFENKNISIGDEVYPLVRGRRDQDEYFIHEIRDAPYTTGLPGWDRYGIWHEHDPHIVTKIEGTGEAAVISTNHGYGFAYGYFKKIADFVDVKIDNTIKIKRA